MWMNDDEEIVHSNGEIVRIILKNKKAIRYKVYFSFNKMLDNLIIIIIGDEKIKVKYSSGSYMLNSIEENYTYQYEGYTYEN